MNKFLTILNISVIVLFFSITNLLANDTYYIDFNKVLNESLAGKNAQNSLKKKLSSETDKFKKQRDSLRKEETSLISSKKLVTSEEYEKKVTALRKKVSELQKNKQKSYNDLATQRSKARSELLKALNPIIKKYMEDKKIRLVIDKKAVLLGDVNLEITSDIMKILNENLKSLKIN
jgi:outer membrane protein